MPLPTRCRLHPFARWPVGQAAKASCLLAAAVALGSLLVGCTSQAPPTVTPAPDATSTGSTSIEIPINPPPGSTLPAGAVVVQPLTIDDLVSYSDPGGRFSIDVPAGWTESRQPSGQPGSYVKLGTVFQPAQGNGLLTVTQFDSGKRPVAVGTTANEVLSLTKVMDLPGYTELGREQVVERPNEALRIEMTYTRTDGMPIHSLVLFQIDGTVFSMVNVGVVADSWSADQGVVRDILGSYKVTLAAVPTPTTG